MFPRGKRSLWFSARNNKFSPDAGLSTTHNWRHRGWGWSGEPRRPPPPSMPHTVTVRPPLSSSHSPSPFPPPLFGSISSHSLYAVIARPEGDIGVRMDRHKGMRLFTLRFSLSLSLSLSVAIQSPVRSSYPPTLSRSLSLSLSLACTSTSGASMTSVLLLVEPFPRWPSTTFSRPLWPCTIRSARSFCAMETRETLYGRG